MKLRSRLFVSFLAVVFSSCAAVGAAGLETGQSKPRPMLGSSGAEGGFIVHVGCGNGRLTAALAAGENCLVHGLDKDARDIKNARDYIHGRGLYGRVSVELWSGSVLPYSDNMVNLLVVDGVTDVPRSEILRVLCPNGVARVRSGHGWEEITKPRPADIDDWTHFLHDAGGNAVAHDRRIGSPRRVQWTAGPQRSRDHDALASLSAMTSSNGRLFYIFDEGHTSLIHRPAKWQLIARDAFNGLLLWKREIPTWVTHLFYFRSGPVQMPRRLVSVGDSVYATLGLDAPISRLDGATGRTLLTYPESEQTEELVCHDNVLLAAIGNPNIMDDEAPRVYGYWQLSVHEMPKVDKSIVAYKADTGEILWREDGENLRYLVPLSLSAHRDCAFYLDNKDLHCVDLKTGRPKWTSPFPTEGLFLRNYAPTVVAYDDVIMCMTWDRLCCFSIEDGDKLWEDKGSMGFASPGDLFAIDGLAWTIPLTSSIWKDNKLGKDGKIAGGVNIPRENFLGNGGKEIWGMDVHTGQVKKSFVRADVLPGGHHHRCYRNKATDRYLICGRRGLEYVDLEGGNHVNNWWLRGECQYGVMPANGLMYIPPDPCRCFNLMKLNGLLALAAENSLDAVDIENRPELEKGPAYSAASARRERLPAIAAAPLPKSAMWQPPVRSSQPNEWPTYRGDITRSGSTKSRVPAKLATEWRREVAGKLSSPVVAGNRVFVSTLESQTIQCLDAEKGEPLWEFTAGGWIDSPPTIYDGLCIFGCRAGSVYCLRASDGKLVWRFRAAPVDRRIISEDRLESVWPVSGSVLVLDDVAYFAAGRSSYLDGGIRLCGLDVHSGRRLYETAVTAAPVHRGKEIPREKMTEALPDLLVSDGRRINMRQVQFDKKLQQLDQAEFKTLICSTGLLEDSWMHRQSWVLGHTGKINSHAHAAALKPGGPGAGTPSGKLIVFDEDFAYGIMNPYMWLKRTRDLYPDSHDGHLHQKYSRYAAEQFLVGVRMYARPNAQRRASAGKQKKHEMLPAQAASDKWAIEQPFQPRAMVLAGDVLFVAGWLDAVAIEEITGEALDKADPDPRSAVLRAVSTADGTTLAEYELDCEPVFDGMAAAYNRLYLSLKDGSIICFKGEQTVVALVK